MDLKLQPQLANRDEVIKSLKHAPCKFQIKGRPVDTLLIHLPFENGATNVSVFFDAIKNGIIYQFVLSCKELENKIGIDSEQSKTKLFNKCLRKLSTKTAHGELGELILFTLLDVYFNAPKLLSKISLKTNRKMPVFGADAVHGQFYDGEFRLYLGESKLYTDFKKAATEAAKSIKSAKEKYEEEFDLLDSYMDFPGITPELENELLDILDPFSEKDISEFVHSPCFIGFAVPELISSSNSESEFIDNYKIIAEEYVEYFYNNVVKQDIDFSKAALFLLPYACAEDLVDNFIEHLGIKE